MHNPEITQVRVLAAVAASLEGVDASLAAIDRSLTAIAASLAWLDAGRARPAPDAEAEWEPYEQDPTGPAL